MCVYHKQSSPLNKHMRDKCQLPYVCVCVCDCIRSINVRIARALTRANMNGDHQQAKKHLPCTPYQSVRCRPQHIMINDFIERIRARLNVGEHEYLCYDRMLYYIRPLPMLKFTHTHKRNL